MNMRSIRAVGLCLTCAFVLAGVAASSALALPEIGRCLPAASGFYKEATCGKKLAEKTGTFEWHKGANKKPGFTATSGIATLEGESGTKIVCKKSTATGKYDEDGTSFVTKGSESVVAIFTECEDPGIGKICHSAGKGEGVIQTEVLEGELRYLKKKTTTTPAVVVQELHPKATEGKFQNKPFAIFECGLPTAGGVKVTVENNHAGSCGTFECAGTKEGGNCILSTLSEVNVMSKTVKDIYVGSSAKQKPQEFLGQKAKSYPDAAGICNLETEFAGPPAPYERSTQTETAEVVSEETVEIKA
jgi:hypothetical protein